MASSSSTEAPRFKKFPAQLVQGVLGDLLAKELDAHFAPENEAKRAAFEASRASLPRRVDMLTAHIAASDPTLAEGEFAEAVSEIWRLLCERPELASITPATLQPCVFLNTLSVIFDAVRSLLAFQKQELAEGGGLVTAAIVGISGQLRLRSFAEETFPELVPLLEWWGNEVCGKRWGVANTWGLCTVSQDREKLWNSPLHVIAECGLSALVPLALAKGCPAAGDFAGNSDVSPASIAFQNGNLSVFDALMAHGLDLLRPYEGDGLPLALALFGNGSGRADVLSDLLRRQPELVHISAAEGAPNFLNLLAAAILSEDAEVVDLVLSAGAPVQHRFVSRANGGLVQTSLALGLSVGKLRIMQLLVEKGKVLEGWKDKYDRAALVSISTMLFRLAVSAYDCNRRFKGDPKLLFKHNPEAMKCVEMVLASGLVCAPNGSGDQALLAHLYPPEQGLVHGSVLEERHAFAVLRRFQRAGFDVLYWFKDQGTGVAFTLAHAAASAGHNEILEWCLGELGLPAEPAEGKRKDGPDSLFACTFGYKNIAGFTLLLRKYKVRAAYPERPLDVQPVTVILRYACDYTDDDVQTMLAALLDRDPRLFDIPCYTEEFFNASDAGAGVRVKSPGNLADSDFEWHHARNPLFMLSTLGHLGALELLLKRNPPGVAAMVNRPSYVALPGEAAALPFKPALWTAYQKDWAGLQLFLRYTDARVTERSTPGFLSIAEVMQREADKPGGPPRALVALAEARAKKELAEKAKSKELTKSAGTTTNAFEDPSVKPLTEKEEKAKAKKKAAKKKAQAKKRAAARAGAGATDVHASPDEDDDDEDDDAEALEEEPDDNLVDSRNAPSLDLMLEQMGLKEKK